MRRKIIALSTMLGIMIAGCSSPATMPEAPPMPPEEKKVFVETEEITYGELTAETTLIGEIEPVEEKLVTSEVSGKVKQLSVQDGEFVQQGQLIATLESDEQEDRIDQAESALLRAKQSVQNAEISKEQMESSYEQMQISLQQAEANSEVKDNEQSTKLELELDDLEQRLEKVIEEHEKVKRLYNKGIVSKLELEQAEEAERQANLAYKQGKLNADNAVGDLEKERMSLISAEKDLTKAELSLEQATFDLQQAQEDYDEAKQKQGSLTLRSPIAGFVKYKDVQEGAFVGQQTPLFSIYNPNDMKVKVNVSPAQKSYFQNGQELHIRGSNEDEPTSANVSIITPYLNEDGFFQVEAIIGSDQTTFIPGEYVEIVFNSVVAQDQLIVPTDSILEKGDRSFVFIVENETAVMKEVEVVQSQSKWTSVEGDLNAGEPVVTKGNKLLSTGLKVQMIGEEKEVTEKKQEEVVDNESTSTKDGDEQ
ncbi:efflux RND transporter periplasmic adaptor subunit [Bacillus solimangrovi]|uniref:Uncharacterized protein n=1 Tax=Bacillus solimangrovi TaxID=1305675 RepID=A0A1E5LDQ9_9BACI|nr:efflux RND transporter periplasmic adaptor subunit [Bacillus solimangrovi]OEH92218.1 hypothetical protein BFG57_02815 [Bacillus solimangrovi]